MRAKRNSGQRVSGRHKYFGTPEFKRALWAGAGGAALGALSGAIAGPKYFGRNIRSHSSGVEKIDLVDKTMNVHRDDAALTIIKATKELEQKALNAGLSAKDLWIEWGVKGFNTHLKILSRDGLDKSKSPLAGQIAGHIGNKYSNILARIDSEAISKATKQLGIGKTSVASSDWVVPPGKGALAGAGAGLAAGLTLALGSYSAIKLGRSIKSRLKSFTSRRQENVVEAPTGSAQSQGAVQKNLPPNAPTLLTGVSAKGGRGSKESETEFRRRHREDEKLAGIVRQCLEKRGFAPENHIEEIMVIVRAKRLSSLGEIDQAIVNEFFQSKVHVESRNRSGDAASGSQKFNYQGLRPIQVPELKKLLEQHFGVASKHSRQGSHTKLYNKAHPDRHSVVVDKKHNEISSAYLSTILKQLRISPVEFEKRRHGLRD